MSNWTHVAGIVRLDSFRNMEGMFKDGIKDNDYNLNDLYDLFGKEIKFDSTYEEWDDAEENPNNYLPFGSEGSLKLDLWTNSDKGCISSYTVSIFGDLRDHDNPQDIVNWFKDRLDKIEYNNNNNVWIRQAVILVDNEWNGRVTYSYKYEE